MGIIRIPVLVFETDSSNCELLNTVLVRQGIPHISQLVYLRKGTAPPPVEYFRAILERHRPKLLISSWKYIGPEVRMATQTMAEPRPEKWVVSGYSIRQLEGFRVVSWADMIYEKPISPLFLVGEIERRLKELSARDPVLIY